MKHTLVIILAALAFASMAFPQAALEIRDVEIDSQSPEGAVLTEAGIAEELDERIGLLEGFLTDFPESTYLGYVLLQLQTLHTQQALHWMSEAAKVPDPTQAQQAAQQHWAKAAEAGQRLLAYVPDDLEVRHNYNQATLSLQQWTDLLESLKRTKPIAVKEAAAPPPEDPTEEEEEYHQSAIDYAQGVVQYIEWGLNVAMAQSEPATQLQYMDALRELYPDSEYAAGIDDKYVQAYQQAGDIPSMVRAMERALANNPGNEQYIYTLAEYALSQQDYDTANGRAEELIQLMEEKPAPEGVEAEAWEATKKKFTALGQYVMGTGHFRKGAWRTSRRHLLQTVDAIKAEGGERYGVLAYMLGFCYVKLDIAGDNIRQATHWMSEAARVPNPMQAQASQTLKAIKEVE